MLPNEAEKEGSGCNLCVSDQKVFGANSFERSSSQQRFGVAGYCWGWMLAAPDVR
jgi:hypothetical protein